MGCSTVVPALRNHSNERPPGLKNTFCTFLLLSFPCYCTSNEKLPVLKYHWHFWACPWGGLSRQGPLYLYMYRVDRYYDSIHGFAIVDLYTFDLGTSHVYFLEKMVSYWKCIYILFYSRHVSKKLFTHLCALYIYIYIYIYVQEVIKHIDTPLKMSWVLRN